MASVTGVTGITGYLESSGLGFHRMDVSRDCNEELASAPAGSQDRVGTRGQNLVG